MSYNKLVRDKIIDIIKAKNQNPQYHILSEEEYIDELHKKLFEEANEFVEADDPEEMADLLEVIYAIAEFRKINLNEVEQIRLEKREKRGGFNEKIYLENVEK